MYQDSLKTLQQKRELIQKYGTLEQRIVSRLSMEQANSNTFPPPERSSTLAAYHREIVGLPPSNYSIDAHMQRVNSEIAVLWGLNLTFLQGDSKVYQGASNDKNTKNVTSTLISARSDISRFFSFLYTCVWKKYDEDFLDYFKTALVSSVLEPDVDLPDESQRKIVVKAAKIISQLAVDIDDMKADTNTALSIQFDLPVYSSASEVISTGAVAVAAGIKQPEQIEAEVDELLDAQKGGVE
jgi:hypothetical protein